jgi:hypothetical protein
MYRRALKKADIACSRIRTTGRSSGGWGAAGEAADEIVNGSGVELSEYPVAPLPEGASFLMIARFFTTRASRSSGKPRRA